MNAGLLVLALSVAACGFGGRMATDDSNPDDTSDAGDTDDEVPDSGPCQQLGTVCANETTLRVCTELGQEPVDTTCAWGCVAASPHCGALTPTGGGATKSDVATDEFANLGDVVITDGAIVNGGDAPTIDGEPPEPGTYDALLRGPADHIRVFRAKSFTFVGNTTLRGDRSIQFVADGRIIVRGELSAVGPCGIGDDANDGGPGGFRGGRGSTVPGGGPGGGGGDATTAGGGGGGNGATGGSGGNVVEVSGNGGVPLGDAAVSALYGGGGGGAGGGGGGYGRGGGGGGAVQLISNTEIVFETNSSSTGSINAGGCGGDSDSGGGGDGGGGGGAGGTIVLEAPIITGMGTLAVNGGGGGGGGNPGTPGKGENGGLSREPAAGQSGGDDSMPGGAGGRGGAALMLEGRTGEDAVMDGGGGGGAIGRMRFNTRTGEVTLAGELSPDFRETPTTASKDRANVD